MAITSDDYQVQVELASITNVAKDSVVNTFAIKALSGTATYADVLTHVDAFYNAIGGLLSPTINAGANKHYVRLYHLSEPIPRPPVFAGQFTQAGSGAPLPAEVALVSSLKCAAPAGTHPARRRGRMFIGPLNTGTAVADSGYSRPSGATMTTLAGATNNLLVGLAASDWALSVWSRKDNTLFPVISGWVNNEWDTQRRRGPEVSSRVVWPA